MAVERRVRLRALIRDTLTVVFIVVTAPLWLLSRLERTLTQGETIFTMCSELLSLVPGPPGIFLRRGFYVMSLDACSWDVSLGFGTVLAHREVRIGQRVYVGRMCSIGMAVIEDDATIGSNVDLLSGRRQHGFDDPDRPVQAQGGTFEPIRIGWNCWVGNRSVVMADIGSNAIIGAGCVVVRPIQKNAVAVGNPARVVRDRNVSRNELP